MALQTVVFGDSFKITNILILEEKKTKKKKKKRGAVVRSMPRYRSNERDENGNNL